MASSCPLLRKKSICQLCGLSRRAYFVLITSPNVSESNRQRLGFTFKGTDLSSTGGHTKFLSLRDANKCEYDCSLFQNNLLLERLGIRVMKRTVGYMAFRRALSINLLPRAGQPWLLFICVRLAVSVNRRLRTADCRLRTRGKLQTVCKMQTAD